MDTAFQVWRQQCEAQAAFNTAINTQNKEHMHQFISVNWANKRWTTCRTFSDNNADFTAEKR